MQGGGADAGGGAGGGAGKGNNPFLDRDSYGIKYYSDTEAGDKIKANLIPAITFLIPDHARRMGEKLFKDSKDLYKQLGVENINQFWQRLYTNRPHVFFTETNHTHFKDSDGTDRKIYLFDAIPQNIAELLDLKNKLAADNSAMGPNFAAYIAQNFLTDEEIAITEWLGMAIPSPIYNDGQRGKPDKNTKHVPVAVQRPWVGFRFGEVIASKENKTSADYDRQTASFRKYLTPRDETTGHAKGTADGKFASYPSAVAKLFKVNTDSLFNDTCEKIRANLKFDQDIAEANGYQAYVRLDGAGTGVWAADDFFAGTDYKSAKHLFRAALERVVAQYGHTFSNISRIELPFHAENDKSAVTDTQALPESNPLRKIYYSGTGQTATIGLAYVPENFPNDHSAVLHSYFAWDGGSKLGNEGHIGGLASNDPTGLNLGAIRYLDCTEMYANMNSAPAQERMKKALKYAAQLPQYPSQAAADAAAAAAREAAAAAAARTHGIMPGATSKGTDVSCKCVIS
jgi:hypothetical protein